jgi:hypothetical protein
MESKGYFTCRKSYLLLYDLHCSSNIYWGDKIKKKKMGRACGTYGGDEYLIQGFSGNMREGNDLEDTTLNGGIILK